jgi:hypothetical protein
VQKIKDYECATGSHRKPISKNSVKKQTKHEKTLK